MPMFQDRRSLAAGASVDNVLAGSQWEFMPFHASLEFAVITDASTGEVLSDVYSGQDVLMEQGAIPGPNRSPVYPDDFQLTDVAAAGERIKVRLRNTGAGAHIVWTTVRITPV